MRTNNRFLPTLSAAACVLALATLSSAAAWASAVPNTTAYFFSSHPMISGTVVTVNDRQMVVNTDQGEQVALELDSRTMAPRDLGPGMVMRAEFVALPDCRLLAQRVLAIRHGTSTDRFQAYANTRDSRESIALNASGRGEPNHLSYVGASKADSRETETQTMTDHLPGRSMVATSGTADYNFSTNPMIAGTVISVNDHRLVLRTRQGQQVTIRMDSRTMLPREIAPGTELRAEFSQMSDGRYYAKRISRIGESRADREQAYAHTQDSDFAVASQEPDCGFVNASSSSAVSVIERRDAPIEPARVAAPEERLPTTATRQPWLLLAGLASLGCVVLVTYAAGVRRV